MGFYFVRFFGRLVIFFFSPCLPHLLQPLDPLGLRCGGKEFVEKVLSTNGRLELHFRPEDPFCKPSVSTEKTCGNLLVKVRREAESSDGLQYQLEVLVVVEMWYLFDKPCDFQ